MPKLKLQTAAVFWQKILKRTVLIFGIGLFLNWWPFVQWHGDTLSFKSWLGQDGQPAVRIMGVLQRIALCYALASILIFYCKERLLLVVSICILLLYWFLCVYFGQGDPYSIKHWFGTAIDIRILGENHLYKGEGLPFDPEGLLSTLPAMVNVILGYFVGQFIAKQGQVTWISKPLPATDNTNYKVVAWIVVYGFVFFLIGQFWSLSFPLNKKIWSSSYVVYSSGLAMLSLGLVIWSTEIRMLKNGLSKFFDVFGKNPLFIFVLSGLLPRLLNLIRIPTGTVDGLPQYTNPQTWFYQHICAPISSIPELGSLLYALCFLALMWGLAYWLDQKQIYIKV